MLGRVGCLCSSVLWLVMSLLPLRVLLLRLLLHQVQGEASVVTYASAAAGLEPRCLQDGLWGCRSMAPQCQ